MSGKMELEGRWLILVVGLPGSGKSTVSSAVRQRVADCVEWDFDDAMPEEFKAKMRSGAVISAPERDHLIDLVIAGWEQRLQLHSAVVSACMLVRDAHRVRIRDHFAKLSCGVMFVHLHAPIETLAVRLQGRQGTDHFCKDERVLRALAGQDEPFSVPHTLVDATQAAGVCEELVVRALADNTGLRIST